MSRYITFRNPLPQEKNDASLERNREYWSDNLAHLISFHDKQREDPQLPNGAILRLEPPIPSKPYCSPPMYTLNKDSDDDCFQFKIEPKSNFRPRMRSHRFGGSLHRHDSGNHYSSLFEDHSFASSPNSLKTSSFFNLDSDFGSVWGSQPYRHFSSQAGTSVNLMDSRKSQSYDSDRSRRGARRTRVGSSDDGFNDANSVEGFTNHEQDRVILTFYNANKQKDRTLRDKEMLRKYLAKSIFYSGEHIAITGSSASGFAFDTSDVDFCITMGKNQPIYTQDTQFEILRRYKRLLNSQHRIQKLILIKARVPLLQFRDSLTGLKVEINVMNDGVSERNTQMLNVYSQMDNRVAPLMLFIKFWARQMCINNAHQHTLSSYAVTLMTIFYLQNTEPRVLPVLHDQVNCDSEDFFSYRPPLVERKNRCGLSDLFLGFLQFYSDFHFDKECISVRTGKRMPFREAVEQGLQHGDHERNWSFVAVEEPFSRTNVARSVYLKAHKDAIVSSFRRSYRIFHKNMDLSLLLRHLP